MATTRKAAPADDPGSYSARDAGPVAVGTDCAICHAPLPDDHRYLCAACVAESAERARAILEGVEARRRDAPTASAAPGAPEVGEADEAAECPTCGMALDASGRCAVCVTTVRR